MRINKAILTGVIVVSAIGLIIYATQKNHTRRTERIRDEVAEEGYETAYDILYPLKAPRFKKYRWS
jgi:predicted nucleic acid-binding protein